MEKFMAATNPGPPGKWPLKWRERERQTDRQRQTDKDKRLA